MNTLILNLWNDEAGFIISAELVLIATILVLGMIVGLHEVATAVNMELEDVASAVGSLNQSYKFSGFHSPGKSNKHGSVFQDDFDLCDGNWDITLTKPQPEWASIW
jgi:Flp pilus assembly pilin Flp